MLTVQQKYELLYRNAKHDDIANQHLCPICHEPYYTGTQPRPLMPHIKKQHPDVYDECVDVIDKYKKARQAETVTCPLCGKQLVSLCRHLQEFHLYESLDDFNQQFPEVPLSVKIKKKKHSFKCDICGHEFSYNNAYAKHLKHAHGIINNKDSDSKTKPFTCEICHKSYTAIKDHVVRKHKRSWEEYCQQYNVDSSVKSLFTDAHKQKLSENKSKFYQDTARGLELRQQQSQSWKENNPSQNEAVRQRLSELQATRQANTDTAFKMYSYGIKFKCPLIGLNNYCRSFEEFKVAYTLYVNRIPYKYESQTVKLEYLDKIRYYVPDFEVKGQLFEIKSDLEHYDSDRYQEIHDILLKDDVNMTVVKYKNFCKILDITLLSDDTIFTSARELLDSNQLDIFYCSRRDAAQSRILNSICANYEQHERIHLHIIE